MSEFMRQVEEQREALSNLIKEDVCLLGSIDKIELRLKARRAQLEALGLYLAEVGSEAGALKATRLTVAIAKEVINNIESDRFTVSDIVSSLTASKKAVDMKNIAGRVGNTLKKLEKIGFVRIIEIGTGRALSVYAKADPTSVKSGISDHVSLVAG